MGSEGGAAMSTEYGGDGSDAEVLRRIRAALGETAGTDAAEIDTAGIDAEWAAIPRAYKRSASLGREAILDLLEDRLRDYDAPVIRAQAGGLTAEIARILTERGKRRLVGVERVGAGVALGESLPAEFEFVTDEGFSARELDGFDGVVTASTVAIAETGTIVLQNVPGQGRRAPTSWSPTTISCGARGGRGGDGA